MNSVIIRQATKKDAKSVTEVLVASQWFTYERLYSKEYIQDLVNQYYNFPRIEDEIISVSDQWHGYFIAEKAGKIVGAIGGGMLDKEKGEVYVFYMDPLMRGQGIGTRLLDFYTKIQKHSYGATEQWVSVAQGNDYAIPFYEARGFIYQYEEPAYGSSKENQDISLKYSRQL